MGATSSSPQPPEDKTIYMEREHPITFSPDLMQHLADNAENPQMNEGRQRLLDDHIKQRIEREIAQLRRDEAEIQAEVTRALERENAEKEKETAEGLDSRQIQQDLEAVRLRIDRQRGRREGIEERVAPVRKAVLECYKANPTRTLDCWKEVEDFKLVFKQLEQEFIHAER